ncbi:MAG: PaaI family thioesterase [Chitinophagales bacterium]|jgi:hypothetical protein
MTKESLIRNLTTPWKWWFFLLSKLPVAWFAGLRLATFEVDRAEVRLPYSWFSKNPFRSIYFAAQSAAAELSTGLLCLYALTEQAPMSMLVVKMRADFYKKADKPLLFQCEMGKVAQAAVEEALATGEAVEFELVSEGRLPDGTLAAKFWFTWSIKRKKGSPGH